jgi:kumamolisin
MTVSLLTIIAIVSIFNLDSLAQPQTLLTHHVRDVVANGEAKLVGRLPANQSMRIDIVMPVRHRTELQNYVEQVNDRSNFNYHRFLTPAEFTVRFGPSQEDWDTLVAFAKANGFAVIKGSLESRDLQLKGTVASVEKALHVTMGVYKDPTEDRTFFAPDREPTVDLPFQLWHISGLDNDSKPHPLYKRKPQSEPGVKSNATTGSCPSASFCGSDMRAAYYGGSLTGTGQNVGLFEFAGTDLTDLSTYYSGAKQTQPFTPTLISTGGYSTTCLDSSGCDDTEQTLDMTQAMGMAPGMTMLYMYVCGDAYGTGTISDTACLSAMVSTTDAPLSKQIGCSWGWTPEDASTLDPYFEQMAAQGQNFFVAAGDSSAWTSSNYPWPSEDGNVVTVGGTDLTTASAGGAWKSETAWADSGGGISPDDIAIPGWQTSYINFNTCTTCSKTYRNGPDVAANANFTFYVCADQSGLSGCTANDYGGTSFAAPMWAGYLALANQQAVTNGDTIGFINPVIYQAAAGSSYSSLFHDITSGSCGTYSGHAGYDQCTGWGSPNGSGLINLLAPTSSSGFSLSASPSSVSVAQGSSGTSTITSTVTGGFDSAVTLTASGQPTGVTVGFSPTSITGTGTSTMTMTVASTTSTGTYTITVTGTSGSTSHTTTVSLTVTAAAGFSLSASPSSVSVAQGSSGTSTITSTVTGGFDSAVTLSASGQPTGVTVGFSPTSITGTGTSTMTMTVASTTSTGTYTITVTGTSGSTSHTTTVSLTVTASTAGFSISASPTSISIDQGSSGKVTITSTVTGGFDGVITLSASGEGSAQKVTFSPTTITGAGTSTMTITVGKSARTGDHTITVKGTSGSTSHTATVTLDVLK